MAQRFGAARRQGAALTLLFLLVLLPAGVSVRAAEPREDVASAARTTGSGPIDPSVSRTDVETDAGEEPTAPHVPPRDRRGTRDFGAPSGLPRPSEMSVAEFERHLFSFLKERRYVELGWCRDKTIRDTGPFLKGVYYGTHPAVRVYYSPGVMQWLVSGRIGAIPDGEMIIKEQFEPPAVRHRDKDDSQLRDALRSWTVMIKDSQGSHDGWFWSNPGADAKVVDYRVANEQPTSGFGLYCVRCHASTQSPGIDSADSPENEFTFASLRNIEGFQGEPILFRVDDSWREQAGSQEEAEQDAPQIESDGESDAAAGDEAGGPSVRKPDPQFAAFYDAIRAGQPCSASCLPPSSYDSVPAQRGAADAVVTSDQCMSCHAGLTGPFGPVSFVHTSDDQGYGSEGVNVSPYGEWRWTPMGLAGRDPLFHAQLESEIALIHEQHGTGAKAQRLVEAVTDTCFRCHGPLGHRQLHQHGGAAALALADVLATPGDVAHAQSPDAPKIAALAREGVSCMVCHRMQPRPQDAGDTRPYLEHFLETSINGNIHLGPPGELYGPYANDEIEPYAMQHALGFRPVHSEYIRSSQLCGTCHTVSLPVLDRPRAGGASARPAGDAPLAKEASGVLDGYHQHLEQATYLEWLNSQFNNETDPSNPHGQSCQECHMPRETFADEVGDLAGIIRTKIAAIQDDSYPDAENLANHASLRIRLRDDYRRHGFAGLNIWLLELFNQFDDVLGVKKTDYMTGSTRGAEQAIGAMVRLARQKTATLNVDAKLHGERATGHVLEATVRVTNLAGHRFPSGVGFRRAFVEFSVVEQSEDGDGERLLWSSGRTNRLGVIIDGEGQPLATELFAEEGGKQRYQPHHQEITSPDQVQIYETLIKDNSGRFTTSFLRACDTVKDNRLLPKGWTMEGPGEGLSGVYLKATHPGPAALQDGDFVAGTGSDTTTYRMQLSPDADPERIRVRATLYYQALPPYYLKNLFAAAPDGQATRRLHALASLLDLEGTPIENWKLEIASDSAVPSAVD